MSIASRTDRAADAAAGIPAPATETVVLERPIAPLAPEGAVSPKDWVPSVIVRDEIDRYLEGGRDFVDHERIDSILADGRGEPSASELRDILAKSMSIKTLDLEEVGALMRVRSPEAWAEMIETAQAIKRKVYNNRIVVFAPLYLSSKCVNSCAYCGFRAENGEMKRRRLDLDEVRRETEALARDFGHKRLVVVFGEHPDSDVDYMMSAIDTIYSVKVKTRAGEANIRRVNVNAAPMSVAKLERLREVGMGTFQVFQETYDRRAYAKAHPARTLKGDYRWRLYCHHRAMEAGVDDVGLGALFGVADWRFDLLGLVSHSRELEKRFNGVGAHTISFPRLEPASNAPWLADKSHSVGDEDFLKIIAILRLAVPYTGLICTAREPARIRNEAVRRGITQMDASTRVGLGAYSEGTSPETDRGTGRQELENQQFLLGDPRSLEELVGYLADEGHITSFCTAGYRIGRTGARIMRMFRDCTEGTFCKLNAILTFREWVDDFAGPETRAKCEALIEREYAEARTQFPALMPGFEPLYQKTLRGCRDLFV